jgi:endonuclease YncB( thermonuclease family)
MYHGKVVRVIDGDTVEAAIEMWPEITILCRVRVASVNCPEMRSRDASEVARAMAAKRFVMNELLGIEAVFTVYGKDNFGRVLCSIKYNDKDLARELINHGHAVEYRPIKTPSAS